MGLIRQMLRNSAQFKTKRRRQPHQIFVKLLYVADSHLLSLWNMIIMPEMLHNVLINTEGYSQQHTGIFFLDLKKAFDTVCHQTLLTKLDHYEIQGPAHKLLSSFLQRKQYVSLNHVHSELQYNNHGVPQGSVLGPSDVFSRCSRCSVTP